MDGLKTINPFSSLTPSHPLPLSLKTISFPRVDDEMLSNIGTENYPMESRV
jgi:hypothetical protein